MPPRIWTAFSRFFSTVRTCGCEAAWAIVASTISLVVTALTSCIDCRVCARLCSVCVCAGSIASTIIPDLLDQLAALRTVMAIHNHHRFIASSLLIIYDPPVDAVAVAPASPSPSFVSADSTLDHRGSTLSHHPDHPRPSPVASSTVTSAHAPASASRPLARLHMIDFGHVSCLADGTIDAGYVHGLDTIIAALVSLHATFQQQDVYQPPQRQA